MAGRGVLRASALVNAKPFGVAVRPAALRTPAVQPQTHLPKAISQRSLSTSVAAARASPVGVPSSSSVRPNPPAPSAGASSSEDQFSIPIIEFSDFLNPSNIFDKLRVADELTTAFKQSGFVYLRGHGISSSQVARTFEASADFFKLPQEIKDSLAWKDPRANRGYVAQGRERVTQATSQEEIAALREQAPDYKESCEIGNENDPQWKNEWPEEKDLPGYREKMLQFYDTAHELHLQVMRAIALGLKLPEAFFDDKCNEAWHTLRLLHYPGIDSKKLAAGGSRAGDHSDYGSITLLFQDDVGGLEVQDPHTGSYVAAKPVEDTIVINVGDLLARWSNDTLRSTLHRVVAPPAQSSGMTPTRYSIAFFCNPNESQIVECLPTCFDEQNPKRYEPISSGDYLEQRLKETYS